MGTFFPAATSPDLHTSAHRGHPHRSPSHAASAGCLGGPQALRLWKAEAREHVQAPHLGKVEGWGSADGTPASAPGLHEPLPLGLCRGAGTLSGSWAPSSPWELPAQPSLTSVTSTPPRRPALDTPAHPSTCTSPSQSHFGVRVQALAPRWRPVCRSLLCREARPQQHRPPEASRTLTRAHAHAQSHDGISDVRASPQALPAFSEVPSSP